MTVGAVVLSTLTTAPAYAAPPAEPTISAPDATTTPGHVTGTVTSSDTAVVTLRLGSDVAPDVLDAGTPHTLSDGTANFDLETWGYAGETFLWARACSDATPEAECTAFVRMAESFVPTDVDPQITFSADTTVGDNISDPSQEIKVTPADTGGGRLVATWSGPNWPAADTELLHVGTMTVDTGIQGYGPGTVTIKRCATVIARCTLALDMDVLEQPPYAQDYTVLRRARMTSTAIAPITVGNANTDVTLTTDARGPYTLHWRAKAGAIWDIEGSATGTVNPDGTLDPVTILGSNPDLSDNPDYEFYVVDLSVDDPDFGMLKGGDVNGTDISPANPHFAVDRQAPSPNVVKIGVKTIYPLINAGPYPGSVKIETSGNAGDLPKYAIRNAANDPIRLLSHNVLQGGAIWDGKDLNNVTVPAGVYKVSLRDDVGNETPTVGTITVSYQKLVTKTWTKKVSAMSSMLDYYFARCSRLHTPATRGWKGSIGYFGAVNCSNQSKKASEVATLHGIKLVNGAQVPKYLSVQVRVWGAASRRAAGSKAYLRYVKAANGVTDQVVLTAGLKTHMGTVLTAPNQYIRASDRLFRWNVYTFGKNRYDVRDFTIIVKYQVLGS